MNLDYPEMTTENESNVHAKYEVKKRFFYAHLSAIVQNALNSSPFSKHEAISIIEKIDTKPIDPDCETD